MKPGLGRLIFGIVLFVGGIAVTLGSSSVIWYGGIVVGLINIVRGAYTLSQNPDEPTITR
ncbi:hypothetical protein BH09MYX1_BH09MYX1_51730 [soil metagenome]